MIELVFEHAAVGNLWYLPLFTAGILELELLIDRYEAGNKNTGNVYETLPEKEGKTKGNDEGQINKRNGGFDWFTFFCN